MAFISEQYGMKRWNFEGNMGTKTYTIWDQGTCEKFIWRETEPFISGAKT